VIFVLNVIKRTSENSVKTKFAQHVFWVDSHTFDSFECAIHALAPVCEYCGVKVIGHGVEADGSFYCCAHCASMAGAEGVSDRA
jgi:hypothetical protein